MAAVKGFDSYSRSKKAKISIGWYFFFQGSVMGNWAALMPAVKSQARVSDPILGAALIAAIFGALVAIPVATYSSKLYGSGFATFFSCFTAIFFLPLIGVATNVGLLILAIVFLGFGLGFADISMNSQAVLCEKMNRSPTLGLFHGIFALGALFAAILCGFLLSLGISVLEEVGIICAIMLLPTIIFRYWLFSRPEEQLIIQSEALFLGNPTKVVADAGSSLSSRSEIRDSLLSAGDFRESYYCTDDSNFAATSRVNNDSSKANNDTIVIHLHGQEDTEGNDENEDDDDDNDEEGDDDEEEGGVGNDSKAAEKLLPQLPRASGPNESESERSGQTDWQKFSFSEPDDLLLFETNNKKRKRKGGGRRSRVSKYVETTQQDSYVLIKICSLCFIAYLGEGSIGDWSAIFLSDQGASPLLCTMGFVGFQLFVAVGRYYSDYLVVEVGRRNILLLAGIVAALGLGLVVWSPSLDDKVRLAVAIIGFSMCGAGLSVVSPLAISLAGSEISSKDMDSSEAIGYVSSVGYIGVLVGPPLLGGLSAVCGGLRWSFLVDAAIVFTVTIVAITLRIKQERRRANTADFLALTETLGS